ncbi:MAG: hypothetical protein JWO93_344 [Micrococcaceae bacterium]|nr:hypothetical protein [Micrococcaceae bacterium]
MTDFSLADVAPSFADVVLDNLQQRYPHSAHHTQLSPDDNPRPEDIHPAFYTSFDWHSCVHMHWLGVSLLLANNAGTGGIPSAALRSALGENLTAEKLAAEGAYLMANPSWERPYGWAWLLRLAATCAGTDDDDVRRWGKALEPLVDQVAELTVGWLDRVDYPVRHGLHTNAAFGVGYLLDAFRALGRSEAAAACEAAARRWFLADRNWAGQWELSGQDFLSAGLCEADLMRRVLDPAAFAEWFGNFLPDLTPTSRILSVVGVTDETDGYMVHLHGLNLTRAGQLARIVMALRAAGPQASAAGVESILAAAVEPLLEAGRNGLESGDFMSSHWLASFAWDTLHSVAELA